MTATGKHARENGPTMKKRLLAIAAACMCCALVTGGTLAYFTAEERAHNVITSGGVEIALNEYTRDADGELVDFPEKVEGVMPGTAVDKLVEVENTGQAAAWVRVWVDKSVTLSDGETAVSPEEADEVLKIEDFNTDAWTQGSDGWWYCKTPLPAKAEGSTAHVTPYLFEKVLFVGDKMGNPYQGSTATVTAYAEAVQYDNNGKTVDEAQGWTTVGSPVGE